MAVQLVIRRLGRVDARWAQNIQRDDGLLSELVPKLQREIDIRCAQATDEVVFERLDRPLGGVDAVIGWFNKLPFAVLLFEVRFERRGGLVVGYVESGLVSFAGKVSKNVVECFNDAVVS